MASLKWNQQLKRIGTIIGSLNRSCADMRTHVSTARRESAPILEDASLLLAQKDELETRSQLLDAFNKHFVMSEDDLAVLSTSSDEVDDHFFAVLKRIKQIYIDCQVLLGNENERLGLELMDQTSRQLNQGYQKLYRWIQKEFKNLNLENPQIGSLIRRALRALSERPTLFQGCLDSFAEARERILTDAFYSALTGSTGTHEQDSMMKPIEFHAHDALRYVGDMLAWTHSAAVSEREALENLFISEGEEFKKGFEAGKEVEPWSAADTETFDGQKALGQLVNRSVSGIARALNQRIQQVLQNHEDAVLLYKLANLISFYHVTFAKLLGPDTALLATLVTCEESALRHFNAIVAENVTSVNADLSAGGPPETLHIPDFLDEALTHFSALLKSYDSSLRPATSKPAAEDFDPIATSALTPYLQACEKMAKQADPPAGDVFMLNCLAATISTLSPYPSFTSHHLASITAKLNTATAILTEHQHAFFLHTSGLHPLLAALAPLSSSSPTSPTSPSSSLATKIRTLAPFQPPALQSTSQTLDDFLPSALMDAMDLLSGLSSARTAREITAEGAERFVEDFEFVEGKLGAVDLEMEQEREREGEGEDHAVVVPLRSLFPRTSGEIRVLLS